MNCQEFKIEFDILYNNISSGQAPGLNGYEKSIYLTLAQEELVKNAYSGAGLKDALEETEKRRKQLSQLVKDSKVTIDPANMLNKTMSITDNANDLLSYMIPIPNDTWFQLYESVVFKTTTQQSPIPCEYSGKSALVMVVGHNEYSLSNINPFRKPNHRKVWRIDYSNLTGNTYANSFVVEILSAQPIATYHTRYLKKPLPIILEDINLIQTGLTIDGNKRPYSVSQTGIVTLNGTEACCELNQVFHRDILNRAVELAFRDYQDKNLATLVQMNQRNDN